MSILASGLGLLAAIAVLMPSTAFAQGTAYYFDVNGTAAGFGTPDNGAIYNQDGNYWTTDVNGVSPAPGPLPGGAQLTFGAVGSDLAGATFSVNLDSNNWTGLAINSGSANITLIGGANAYLINTQTWTVAAGSTLTDDDTWNGNALNFNGAALTLAGGGTINFQTSIGYNDNNTITENGSGLVVNFYANTSGANSGNFNLVSGTLNFAATPAAGAFNGFGSNSTVTIGGGTTIDNTSGSAMTLAIGSGSYDIGGSFTFTGSSSLNLGAAAVMLAAPSTITVGNNALTIGGPIGDSGAGYSITKAGNGTLVLAGANTYSGGTTIDAGTLRVTTPSGAASSGVGTGALTVNAGAAFSYLTGSATPSTLTLLPTTGTALTLAAGSSIGTQILDTIALNASGASVALTPTTGSVTLNIYGVAGQTVSAGTQTLLSSPNGGLNGNGAATFVPVIYNNTNFTVGNFTVGANAVTIDTTPQSALTAEYWLGGFSGASGAWAASDGTAHSNWAADSSGTPTPLIPGPTATINFSASGATGQGSMTLGANMAIGGLVSNDSNPVTLNNDANNDALTIGAGGITVGNTNVFTAAVTINAPLVLSASQSWTNDSSNALTVSGGINNGANLLTIAGSGGSGGTTISGNLTGTGGLALSTNATISASSSAVTIQPGTIDLGSSTLTLVSPSATQSVTISSPITGSGGVTMAASSGVAIVSGSLSYSGATTLNPGSETLVLQNVVPAGSSTGISIGSGATLQYNFTDTNLTQPGITISGAGTLQKTGPGSLNFGSQGNIYWDLGAGSLIDIEAGSITGGNSIQDYWTNNLSSLNIASGAVFYGVEANVRIDALTGAGTFEGGYGGAGYSVDTIGVNNGSGIFYGSLQNDAAPMNIEKVGTGTQTFAGTGYYTGTTTVSGGTLIISGAISDATPITVNSGAILSLTGNNATGNGGTTGTYTINGGTISNDGPAGTMEVINGNLYLNGGMLAATSAPNGTYGNFAMNDNGSEVVVTGTSESTISASLHLEGTHVFDIGSTGNPVDLLVSGQVGNFEYIAWGLITKTGPGTMWLANSGNTFGDLAINAGQVIFSTGGLGVGGAGYKADFTGNSTLTWATGNTDDPSAGSLMKIEDGVTATLNTNGNTVTLGTAIVVGANGTGALNVDDTAGTPGVLILGGANTYSGGTTINAGTLRLTGSGTFGNINSTLTMNGGVLDLNGTSQGAGFFNGSATATVLNNGSGMGTLTVGNGNATGGNFLGVIADNNNSGTSRVALTKTGTGTFQLSAVNMYSGPTTVNGGTLVLSATAGLGNTAITVNSGGTLLTTPGSGTISAGNASTAGAGASLTLSPGTGSNAGGSFSLVDGAIGTFSLQQGAGFSGPALTLGGAGTSANAPMLSFEIGPNRNNIDLLAAGGNASVGTSGAAFSFSALSSDTSLVLGDYTFITAAGGLGPAATGPLTIATPILSVGGNAYALSLGDSTATAEILTISSSNPFPANAYWNGGQSSNWNTFIGTGTTNWSTDATGAMDTAQVPGPQTNVFFTVTSGASNLSTNLGQPFAINSLNFTGAGTSATNPISISGSTLTINAANAYGANPAGSGIIVAAGTGAVSIASNVTLGANQTWTNDSTNSLTVSGSIGDGGNNYGITTAGSGTIVLTGVNTYGGGTTISSGVLNINADAALGMTPSSPTTNLTFSGNGTLQAGGAASLSANRSILIDAGVTATIDTNSNNLAIAGAIAGGDSNSSLVKIGSGILTLTGTSTYAGSTTVSAGTLQIGDGTTNGSLTSNITNNATLVFNTIGSQSYNGAISGSGGLTKTGAGTLVLSNASNYNGNTVITGGTLRLQSPTIPSIGVHFIGADQVNTNPYVANAPNGSGAPGATMNNWMNLSGASFSSTPLNDNSGAGTGATFTVTNAGGTYNSGSSIPLLNGYLYWGGTLTLNISSIPYTNYSLYVYTGGVESTAGGRETNATIDGTTYYLSSDTTPTSYDLVTSTNPSNYMVGDYVLATGLTGGSQTVTLDNLNGNGSFSGFEIVDNVAPPPANLLPVTTGITIASGSTFDLNGNNQQVASLSDYAPGNHGTVTNSDSNSVTLTLAPPVGSATFSGTIQNGSGTVALTINGAGTQILAGTNTYTGGTTITGGTLQLGDGIANNGSVVGNISNNATLTFANPNPQTYAGVISGNGAVNKIGAGTLTLSGAGTNNGALTVNGGTVALTNTQSYSSATIQSGTLRLVELTVPSLPSVPGLQYHLDASNSSNLTLTGSNGVASWNDLSGNGVNFVQGTPGNQPTYIAGTAAGNINGLGVVSFNGSTSVLAGNSPTSVQTVFIIDQPNSSLYTNLNGIFGQNNNDYSIRLASASSWQNNGGTANGNDFTGNGGSMYIDGAPQSGNGNFTPDTPQLLEAVSPGSNYFTAALGDSYPGRYFGGTIGEVLVYSGTLTPTEQAEIDTYLTEKWLTPLPPAVNVLPTTSVVNITGSGATFDLGTTMQTIASLSGVAGSNVNLESETLTIGGSSTTTFAGTMSGAGSLAIAGSGVLTLSGVNTYSGGTTVSSGTLNADAASGTTPLGTGPLVINGSSSIVNANSTLTVGSLSGTGGGQLNVAGSTMLTVNQTTTSTFIGTLTLNGGLVLAASSGNTLTISGAPTLASGSSITVNSGTLGLTNSTGTAATVSGTATVSVAPNATLQLAGSANVLSSVVNITTQGSGLASDGAVTVVGASTQTVGVISGATVPTSPVTTYAGNTTVGDGTIAANLTATQILQNTLTINAGSTVTIAPSGSGIPLDEVATTSAVATSDVATAAATADGDSSSDPFTAIEAAIASGSISSAKGEQLESRIAAIERLATTHPGLDVSLLEDRVLAALPATSVWSSSGTSPLVESGSGLLAMDSSTSDTTAGSTLGGSTLDGSAAFAPAVDFSGSPAAVPEPSTWLLAVLGGMGILIAIRRRTICCG